jgi:uncharacterized membrane protein HdeD (DUF308 family)
MPNSLPKNWWTVALRALLALTFGSLTFFLTGVTLKTVALLFGAYTVADGFFSIPAFFPSGPHARGLVSGVKVRVIIAITGILTLAWPSSTLVFAILFTSWPVFIGMIEIAAGIRLGKVISGVWLLLLIGFASWFFGVSFMFTPGLEALAIILRIRIFTVISAIFLVALAFRLRSHLRLMPQVA